MILHTIRRKNKESQSQCELIHLIKVKHISSVVMDIKNRLKKDFCVDLPFVLVICTKHFKCIWLNV